MLKRRTNDSKEYRKVKKTIFGRTFFIVIPMSLMLLTTGCSKIFEQTVNEEAGVAYDLSDTSIESLDAGAYIKEDNTLYVPYNGHGINLTKNVDDYEAEKNKRYIWYTTQLQYVPELNADGSVIFKSEDSIPSSFPLEKFEKLCDTIGIKGITLDAQGNFILKVSDANLKTGSDAATIFADYSGDDTIILDTINDIPFESSMVNKAGSISGLELDKSYKLGFYIGTKYHEEVVTADTTLYASKEMYQITRYDGTKLGYIVLKLPDLMDPGLYYLNGQGTFTYGGLITADKGDSTDVTEETESDDSMAAAEQAATETLSVNSFTEETQAAQAKTEAEETEENAAAES